MLVTNEKMAALIRQANIWTKWKKDQTTEAGGKRKRAAVIRQANSWHQMKETKQLKPPQKRKRWPTCKNKVEKNTPNHNSLIDFCLQQMSGQLHWLYLLQPLEHRDNCADKQMES